MTERILIERRARETGTTVQLVDRGDSEGWGDWRWETICVDHGGVCSHETRQLATSFLSHPNEWCPTCQNIVELAEFNPGFAIEGWLAGYEANGDKEKAEECRRALEIQAAA